MVERAVLDSKTQAVARALFRPMLRSSALSTKQRAILAGTIGIENSRLRCSDEGRTPRRGHSTSVPWSA
jgi:hypothetical protein